MHKALIGLLFSDATLTGQDNYDIRGIISWGNYDIREFIKRLGYVTSTQSEFRPGLDHNPVFGIEILR